MTGVSPSRPRALAASCVALLFTVCAAPAVADLSSVLGTCSEGIEDLYEYEPLAPDCPEALALVENSQLRGTLADDWRESLTWWEAEQLGFFETYYASSLPADGIALSTLDEIVAELGNPTRVAEEKTLWQRFKDWLRDVFTDDEGKPPTWLDEWLSKVKIPESVLEWTFWILAAMIIIAAIVVVAIEIRAARRGRGRYIDRGQGKPGLGSGTDYRPLTIADLDAASLQDKPGVVLRLLVQSMEARGLLPHRPASTHRELALEGASLDETQRTALTRVSGSAERVRYGDSQLAVAEVDDIVATGMSLLDRLARERG